MAVRFCPLLFKTDNSQENKEDLSPLSPPLPYKMILAVATMDSVLLYETTTFGLVALLGGIHLAPITDLSWSHDALNLAVSSR